MKSRSDPGSRSKGALLLATALLVICYGTVHRAARPPAALGADVAPDRFSAGRALETLREIGGDGLPHPAGVAAHQRLREKIIGRFEALGYTPEVQTGLARGPYGNTAVARNVIARTDVAPVVEKDAPTPRAVLLVAHYDSVGSSPGAGDDLSGVAALLEIARILRTAPTLPRPVIFLISDATEVGLAGATLFSEQHPWSSEVGFVVNLEARGTSGQSVLFETGSDSAWLIPILSRNLPRPRVTSAADRIYKKMPHETDLTVFLRKGVPGLNFAFVEGLSRYHTPRDDLAHLDPSSVQHQGANALAMTRALAACDLDSRGEAHEGRAVFFDVLSLFIIWWPASWTLPLAGLAALANLLGIIAWLRRGALSTAQLALGLLVCGLLPLACVLFGSGWIELLGIVRGVRESWVGYPLATRCSLLFGTLTLCGALGGSGLARRVGIGGLWLAGWTAASTACVLASIVLPEVSYLFILPALSFALASLILRPLRPPPAEVSASGLASGARELLAVLMPLGVTAILWFPVARAMEIGLGFRPAFVVVGPLSIVGVVALPVFLSGTRRANRIWIGVTAGIATMATAAALALPTHTEERPGWLSIRFIQNADAGRARWDVSTYGSPLPAKLSEAADFERSLEPPFPWLSLDRSLFAAPAPLWDVPAPNFLPFEERLVQSGRIVKGKLLSPRGATRLHLHLPEGVEILSVTWKTHVIRGGYDGNSHIFCALGSDGIEVELRLPEKAVELWVLDQDWPLPPEAQNLLDARPSSRVPCVDGDVSILGRSVPID